MSRKMLFPLFILSGILFLASCSPRQVSPTAEANKPNPASVFCEQNGGTLELRQDANGGVQGICIFPNGSECDEWTFYRGECKPATDLPRTEPSVSPAATATTPAPTATEEIVSDGWKVYRNEKFGYSFHYPAGATFVMNDDPLGGLTVMLSSGAAISISHPSDREEYRPPASADLAKWLSDHYLSGEKRLADRQIAGTAATHYRHERSPQSYADDRYFFAKEGQLYQIIIGHAGDKEDWEVYNRFLDSFQFEK